MNKRIIVITTNLISQFSTDITPTDEDNYLFKRNAYVDDLYADEKCCAFYEKMLAFWGKCISFKIGSTINKCDFDSNILGLTTASKIKTLINNTHNEDARNNAPQDDYKLIAKSYKSYWTKNDGEPNTDRRKNNMESLYNRAYKLSSSDNKNEVYALAHLPRERDSSIFSGRDVQIVREEWIDAIKNTFRDIENSADVYIILHGSTDYKGESHHFTVVDDSNNIAIFMHETTDEMMKILKPGLDGLSAKQVADKVECLFRKTTKIQNIAQDNEANTRGYYK